ncbi:uncharacterized protein LOC113240455 [Hyposmocoma kahamanoa]|uniref:uncharacterized protein LOC113240455 n=1 Tax=Hyposmocoma kahamanoa TaxID=1477025 RepID=UPI000E6D5E5E|nr:uncharacterized protein LOC113240455 [Hyposmocoma kahamanoa]
MKVVISVVVMIVGTVVADSGHGCEDISDYYLELGCTPVKKAGNSSECPKAFTCPDIKYTDPAKCYYRGVAYEPGAAIPQSEILNPCSRVCVCQISGDVGARFECAQVDCVETFSSEKRECLYTFNSLNDCCSTGSVCGKDAVAALKNCEIDDRSFKEGEMFEPANRHKICLCSSEWDGNIDSNKSCRDINCGIELHYQPKLRQNCAPVFSEHQSGSSKCPIGFQCPNDSIKVTRLNKVTEVTEKCVFGNDTLAVGDEVTVMEKCVTCKCGLPPSIHCIKVETCDN